MAATGIVPTVDFVFKRLFATEENRGLLVHFLNSVIQFPPEHRIAEVELTTPVNDRETEEDKLTVVDIRVRDQSGRVLIIEMQMIVTRAFRERLLYYWARDYRDQLRAGDDYTLLKPTLLVCVVAGQLFADAREYHQRFRVQSDDGAVVFTDRLEIHTIELGKFEIDAQQIETDLDRWTFFLKNGNELDPVHLPDSLNAPEILRAVEVLDVISQSERDRVEYEMRLKRQRDMINRDKLLVEGGVEQGIEMGLKRGELIGRVRQLQELLREQPISDEDARSVRLDSLTAMVDELVAKLRSPS